MYDYDVDTIGSFYDRPCACQSGTMSGFLDAAIDAVTGAVGELLVEGGTAGQVAAGGLTTAGRVLSGPTPAEQQALYDAQIRQMQADAIRQAQGQQAAARKASGSGAVTRAATTSPTTASSEGASPVWWIAAGLAGVAAVGAYYMGHRTAAMAAGVAAVGAGAGGLLAKAAG